MALVWIIRQRPGESSSMPAEGVDPQELQGHQQAAQHRDEHEDQGGHEVPEDQPLIDQLFVARQFLFQGRFLTLFQMHAREDRVPLVDGLRRASSPGPRHAAGSLSR